MTAVCAADNLRIGWKAIASPALMARSQCDGRGEARMKKLFESAVVAGLAAVCLTTAACDSQATKEVKKQADAIDQSYEAEADLKEASALSAPNENAVHEEADALRNKGEAIKDHLKNEAEEVD
jgi:hypothetical protein